MTDKNMKNVPSYPQPCPNIPKKMSRYLALKSPHPPEGYRKRDIRDAERCRFRTEHPHSGHFLQAQKESITQEKQTKRHINIQTEAHKGNKRRISRTGRHSPGHISLRFFRPAFPVALKTAFSPGPANILSERQPRVLDRQAART